MVALGSVSKVPGINWFATANKQGLEHDSENQRKWNELVIQMQEIT
ncbi:hypothetical protein So717_37360 [Roseobacter cerasinus]|uniref:Uncharacterized protein n=1 Tax=Roseobacter cerasinus TaxID=2602289 RepID=A0A640VV03_9RHOB|nr:hypothetical protein So717_37360 [Roseobacter cerasinus]